MGDKARQMRKMIGKISENQGAKKDMNERMELNPPRELQSENHNDWPVTYQHTFGPEPTSFY